uniref:Uncharacterized protein n=1 Tax=Oryza punctata TaxID=4537 RepID=A0A0E0JKZ4_ORYPU
MASLCANCYCLHLHKSTRRRHQGSEESAIRTHGRIDWFQGVPERPVLLGSPVDEELPAVGAGAGDTEAAACGGCRRRDQAGPAAAGGGVEVDRAATCGRAVVVAVVVAAAAAGSHRGGVPQLRATPPDAGGTHELGRRRVVGGGAGGEASASRVEAVRRGRRERGGAEPYFPSPSSPLRKVMSSRGRGDSGACRWEDVTSRMQQGYEQDCFAAPWLSRQDLYSPAVAPLHDLRQKKPLGEWVEETRSSRAEDEQKVEKLNLTSQQIKQPSDSLVAIRIF